MLLGGRGVATRVLRRCFAAFKHYGPGNENMVKRLLDLGLIRTKKVETAMLAVDRSNFIPAGRQTRAYDMEPQPIEELGFVASPAYHSYVLVLPIHDRIDSTQRRPSAG